MLRHLLFGSLVGLVLAYTGLSMQAYRPGTLLPQALFFGPWIGVFSMVERPLRQYGYWVYLTPPLLVLGNADIVPKMDHAFFHVDALAKLGEECVQAIAGEGGGVAIVEIEDEFDAVGSARSCHVRFPRPPKLVHRLPRASDTLG